MSAVPPPEAMLFNLPTGQIADELNKAVNAVNTINEFVNGPFGFFLPATVKGAIGDLTKMLTAAQKFLHLKPPQS